MASDLVRSFCGTARSTASDVELLDRYFAHGDQPAFEALLQRHGPMVLGVCRRVLHDGRDVEDAFQATFIVFLRKASSLGRRELLARWLYGVAYRTALAARKAAARRRIKEMAVARREQSETTDGTWHELRPLLDRELTRLPDKYRMPVVLCDLQGKTRREAAVLLGWPEGTVSGRLARARALLAKRLRRHCPKFSAASLTATLTAASGRSAVPATLWTAVVRNAAASAAARSVGGSVSARALALALAQGVLNTMRL